MAGRFCTNFARLVGTLANRSVFGSTRAFDVPRSVLRVGHHDVYTAMLGVTSPQGARICPAYTSAILLSPPMTRLVEAGSDDNNYSLNRKYGSVVDT